MATMNGLEPEYVLVAATLMFASWPAATFVVSGVSLRTELFEVMERISYV